MKVAIIIVNWNGKKDTLECLRSLKAKDHEIIVVDNGSTDNSLSVLMEAFPSISYIDAMDNLGFAAANNLGIQLAMKKGADLFFLLNNDTIVPADIIDQITRAIRQKPEGGIFGAKIFSYAERDKIDHFGGMWNPSLCEFESIGKNKKDVGFDAMQPVDYVCGCAMAIKKEVIEKIGFLEDKFFLLWEESDYCTRAKKAGFSIWTMPKVHVFHKISASFEGKAHSHYYWWRNRLLFLQRNFASQEKRKLFLTVMPDAIKEFRHFCIKGMLLFLFSFFSPKKCTATRISKWQCNKAACMGIWDFFRRSFGGPKQLKKNHFFSKKLP